MSLTKIDDLKGFLLTTLLCNWLTFKYVTLFRCSRKNDALLQQYAKKLLEDKSATFAWFEVQWLMKACQKGVSTLCCIYVDDRHFPESLKITSILKEDFNCLTNVCLSLKLINNSVSEQLCVCKNLLAIEIHVDVDYRWEQISVLFISGHHEKLSIYSHANKYLTEFISWNRLEKSLHVMHREDAEFYDVLAALPSLRKVTFEARRESQLELQFDTLLPAHHRPTLECLWLSVLGRGAKETSDVAYLSKYPMFKQFTMNIRYRGQAPIQSLKIAILFALRDRHRFSMRKLYADWQLRPELVVQLLDACPLLSSIHINAMNATYSLFDLLCSAACVSSLEEITYLASNKETDIWTTDYTIFSSLRKICLTAISRVIDCSGLRTLLSLPKIEEIYYFGMFQFSVHDASKNFLSFCSATEEVLPLFIKIPLRKVVLNTIDMVEPAQRFRELYAHQKESIVDVEIPNAAVNDDAVLHVLRSASAADLARLTRFSFHFCSGSDSQYDPNNWMAILTCGISLTEVAIGSYIRLTPEGHLSVGGNISWVQLYSAAVAKTLIQHRNRHIKSMSLIAISHTTNPELFWRWFSTCSDTVVI